MTREERMNYAAELFCEGYNCSQAVFAAFCDLTGYEKGEALRLASSFGGGFARHREVCGAVSGAVMVLGALYGYDEPIKEKSAEHYARVSGFLNDFKELNQSIVCRDLLKLSADKINTDSHTPTPTERSAEFYRSRPCARIVMCAVDLLLKHIEKIEESK